MTFRKSLPERLWSRLNISSQNGCWEWTGHKLNGYGQIGLGRREHGIAYTHVLAWIIDNGREPPSGHLVCHKCDNPACCNPDHLFLGTHKDNTQDMIFKKRHSYGEKHATKLTQEDVVWIKRLAARGDTQAWIAERYSVSTSMIGHIVRGERWAA